MLVNAQNVYNLKSALKIDSEANVTFRKRNILVWWDVKIFKKSLTCFQGLTILCDSSSVRLVSSGNYENSVTVAIDDATEEDMDYENNVVMVCPGFA